MANGQAQQTEPVDVQIGPSVDELVGEALSSLPQLTLQRGSVEQVMTVFATYVGSPDIPVLPVDRETALLELDLTHGWGVEDIGLACERVMEGLAEEMSGLQAGFEQATGTPTAAADFEAFSRRYTEERQEQAEVGQWARELLEVVKVTSGQLGIVNPDPGLRPAEPVKEVKEERLLDRVAMSMLTAGRSVAAYGMHLVVIPPPREKEVEEPSPLPSWMTQPVLRQDDRDLKLMGLVQSRLSAEADVQLVWSTLERLNLGRERLTELLERVATKARQQLAQSQQILQEVAAEYQQFAGKLEAIQNVQQIVLSVHDFFFPEEATAPTG